MMPASVNDAMPVSVNDALSVSVNDAMLNVNDALSVTVNDALLNVNDALLNVNDAPPARLMYNVLHKKAVHCLREIPPASLTLYWMASKCVLQTHF